MEKIGNTILAIKEVIKENNISLSEAGTPKKPIKKFISFLKEVKDARMPSKVEFPLHEIILVAFLAILAGAGTIADISDFAEMKHKWLKEHFYIKHGIPSHDTFRRVLSLIDPALLQAATVTFLLDNIKMMKRAFNIKEEIKQYCVDGKTACGTGRLAGTEREVRQLQTLHVYDRTNDICIFSKAIDTKSNEIPAAQEILRMLDLKGAIVTFDSMNTQIDTITAVVDQKGDYVAALKGNHPTFVEEVRSYFTSACLKQIEKNKNCYVEVKEKSHNRIETRRYYLSKNVSWLLQVDIWKGLKSLVCYTLHTEDINTGKTTDEVHYYISSVTDVEICADSIRGHWAVEVLHWHLDCTMSEDDIEIIDRNAFQNISLLNKMALSLLKLIAPLINKSVRRARKCVGLESDILLNTFGLLNEDILVEAMMSAKAK